jgi:hypothetical protein
LLLLPQATGKVPQSERAAAEPIDIRQHQLSKINVPNSPEADRHESGLEMTRTMRSNPVSANADRLTLRHENAPGKLWLPRGEGIQMGKSGRSVLPSRQQNYVPS